MLEREGLGKRVRDSLGFNPVVSRNLRVKALSEVFVKAGRLLLIVLAARMLGPAGFGLYSLAFAFGNILGNLADFGLQMHLSREVARGVDSRPAVLRQVVRAKLLLSAVTVVVMAVAAHFYPRPLDVRLLLLLLGLAGLVQSWNELWNYFFRGIQSLREEAWLNLLNMTVGTGLGIAALAAGWGPRGLGAALLLSGILTSAVAVGLLRSRGLFDKAASSLPARDALRQAAPIGLAILLAILYFRIDVLFLERMKGDSAVGAYSAAYRILESFLFLPAIFLAALYPAFAETTGRSHEDMRRIYGASLRWMGLLSLAIAGGTILFAPLGLRILYGKGYAGSIVMLRLLAPSLVFIFLNYALTHFLVALRGQRWNAIFAGACLLVNAGCNTLLVPRFGGEGAAVATVITEATLFVLCLTAVRRRMARHEAALRSDPAAPGVWW